MVRVTWRQHTNFNCMYSFVAQFWLRYRHHIGAAPRLHECFTRQLRSPVADTNVNPTEEKKIQRLLLQSAVSGIRRFGRRDDCGGEHSGRWCPTLHLLGKSSFMCAVCARRNTPAQIGPQQTSINLRHARMDVTVEWRVIRKNDSSNRNNKANSGTTPRECDKREALPERNNLQVLCRIHAVHEPLSQF